MDRSNLRERERAIPRGMPKDGSVYSRCGQEAKEKTASDSNSLISRKSIAGESEAKDRTEEKTEAFSILYYLISVRETRV